jgi:D-galacturonate reductase
MFDIDCEDTITLTVQWENVEKTASGEVKATGLGTAVYTSSWIAPKSDVHSQQRFFYMGQKGEVNVDQAHRGYNMSADGQGYRSVNPLFMKYTPSDGKFAGQLGYGYRSFEYFIDAVAEINGGRKSVSDYDHSLASIAETYRTSAILGKYYLTQVEYNMKTYKVKPWFMYLCTIL